MNYENATDFELEVKLANILDLRWHCQPDKSPTGFWIYSDNYTYCRDGRICESLPNYCTDWNATMPLAVEYKVSLIPSINEDYYRAIPVAGDIVHDKKPLRAIVICLIKVLEDKQ